MSYIDIDAKYEEAIKEYAKAREKSKDAYNMIQESVRLEAADAFAFLLMPDFVDAENKEKDALAHLLAIEKERDKLNGVTK